ncbi:MAG TPA: YraN family protein [Prolixibacteraceae bacterium]|nr:YraN family protein [Bacteroidales bacterium]HQN93623.1 YraN family protein [Prolixibacteraceae bacterium]
MAEKNELGRRGEQIACEYLIRKGMEIKERNWRYRNGEIDIIANDKKELVIVEVKTRSAAIYEEPKDSISDKKIRFLVNAAEEYIMQTDFYGETRFDIISIKWYGNEHYEIDHIPEAFYPPVV